MRGKKSSSISARIPKEEKDRIRLHVEKGRFPSLSAFYRTAISRFLKELDTYERKRLLEKKKVLGREEEKEKQEVEEEMEDLIKFVEDLY